MDKKTLLVLGGFVLVAVLVIGGAIVSLQPEKNVESGDKKVGTTTKQTGNNTNDTGQTDTTEESASVDVGFIVSVDDVTIPHPPINREIAYGEYVLPDTKIVIAERLANVRANLTKEPYSFPDWLNLGGLYNTAGDYKATEEVWLYLNEASPRQSITFGNLAYLYHIDLKNYPKSEENFRKAIENNPGQALYYHNLHELYKYSYKTDTTLAVDILKEGLVAIPENLMLMMDLGRYYKDTGQKELAISAFTEARVVAEKQGQTEVVTAIDAEIKALNQQ